MGAFRPILVHLLTTLPQTQARRDDESGTGRDSLVDLLRPHDRAGPDEDIGVAGDAVDRVDGNRRPEGHLGDRQPTRLEGQRHRHRSLELLEHDDRDDSPAQHRPQDVVLSHLLSRDGLDQRRRSLAGTIRRSPTSALTRLRPGMRP